jgi:hypothetical protein
LDLAGQLAAFAQTRAATLKLVDQLKEAGVSDTLKADHNDYGQLSSARVVALPRPACQPGEQKNPLNANTLCTARPWFVRVL